MIKMEVLSDKCKGCGTVYDGLVPGKKLWLFRKMQEIVKVILLPHV